MQRENGTSVTSIFNLIKSDIFCQANIDTVIIPKDNYKSFIITIIMTEMTKN